MTTNQGDPMPTIHHEIQVSRPSAEVWDAVADVGALHTRLVPGFVTDTVMLSDVVTPTRRVTFASGFVADEVIINCDPQRRRLSWTIKGVEHHNGVLEVFDHPGGSRVVWTADVLPIGLAAQFEPNMGAGLAAMKAHLEAG
jgi:carbon monoxide dehydrogenase subunit G